MKKQIALAMCILIAMPVQAVDVGKVLKKIVKCSWHVAKIGGGLGCWSVSPLAFGSTMLFHKIPNMPEVGNVSQAQVRDILNALGDGVNGIVGQYGPAIDNIIGQVGDAQVQQQLRDMRGRARATPARIAQAEQWFAANQQAMQSSAALFNTARRTGRNFSLLYLIGFVSAGGASIWSGITGLGEELSSGHDPESDLSEFQFAE